MYVLIVASLARSLQHSNQDSTAPILLCRWCKERKEAIWSFNFQEARQEAITIMLSMDCMEVPSLGSLLRKRSREGSKRMWEEEQGEEEEGWGIKEEVLWGKRKGKVCEVMQLAVAVCGGQLLYGPCCIVPPSSVLQIPFSIYQFFDLSWWLLSVLHI